MTTKRQRDRLAIASKGLAPPKEGRMFDEDEEEKEQRDPCCNFCLAQGYPDGVPKDLYPWMY